MEFGKSDKSLPYFALISGIVVMIFSLVYFLVDGTGSQRSLESLQQHGVLVDGVIFDKLVRNNFGDRHVVETYFVSYSFTAISESGTEIISNEERVDQQFYESVTIGDEIQLIYSVEDPDMVRINGNFQSDELLLGKFLFVISSLVATGGLFCVILTRQKA